jgi:hypothetical protein
MLEAMRRMRLLARTIRTLRLGWFIEVLYWLVAAGRGWWGHLVPDRQGPRRFGGSGRQS